MNTITASKISTKAATLAFLSIAALLAISCASTAAVVVPICTATSDQMLPSINGNWIVWEDWRSESTSGGDIYAYNIEDATERTVCTNSTDQWSPSVWGDVVVWMDGRNAPYNVRRFDIYSFNLATNTESPVTITSRDKWNPVIYGNRVVWEEQTSGQNWDIKSALLGGSVQTICSAALGQYDSAIWNNRIVWDDFRKGTDYDIYSYNLQTSSETAVCTAADDQFTPSIYGDIVVWQDYRNAATGPDIYMKNLSTGVETAVCTDSSAQWNPRIWGNYIVWEDFRGSHIQIYGYDLTTHQEVALTNESADCTFPRIWGNKVVFMRGVSPNVDVCMTFFEPASCESLALNTAKTRADETAVKVTGNVVTGRFGGMFYMEDPDRQCGIRVLWPSTVSLGATTTVWGVMRTKNGERYIDATNVQTGATPGVPKPLGMSIGSLCGMPTDPLLPTVPGAAGLSNTGLLVRVAGVVEDSVSADHFYLKDGSGGGAIKVKVLCGSISKPAPGDCVAVTGDCTTAATLTGIERAIRVRSIDDITPVTKAE